ncbi:MAG: porphobilinogen synthase [Anaerolineales bacterium]|nr:porphobilinogen synthase [Anaerolineales bacterium]
MLFPKYRARRMRASTNIRRMVCENRLSTDMLVYPMFVTFGKNKKEEISSMPGNFRFSVDLIGDVVKEVESLGIPAVILFGIPKTKDENGSEAYNPNGVVQQAVSEIKSKCPDMVVITDVCIDEYTTHGHCGVVSDGKILNDPTLELLESMALTHANVGADIVAPSDMMDGRVDAIRRALDENGHIDVSIMSYSAKYASSFYGPFREACSSSPQFGDRSSYQMDPANSLEAIREVNLDIAENADILMVKPALPYLDIVSMVKSKSNLPIAAYSVSGEYSMIEAAGKAGWLDRERAHMEALLSIHRAGANIIITYFAKEAAKIINN